MTWHHPEGGQAKYLEAPFLDGAADSVRRIGKTLLDPEGPVGGMTEVTEQMARDVFDHAPFEFGDLRASGHPYVVDGGRVVSGENGKTDIAGGHRVYDRPPAVHRLTEDELRAKGDLHRLGLGHS